MTTGTGLEEFAKNYPDRFDVGIAEACRHLLRGLSAGGLNRSLRCIPPMQRCFDQLAEDRHAEPGPYPVTGQAWWGTTNNHPAYLTCRFIKSRNTYYSPDSLEELSCCIDKHRSRTFRRHYPKAKAEYDRDRFASKAACHID